MKLISRNILANITLLSIGFVVFVYPVTSFAAYKTEQVDVSNALYKDFVIGPGKVEVTLKPGERKTVNIKVTNRMGEPKSFKIETEDFTGSQDPRQTVVLLGGERGPYSLKDYISVPETVFELKNGERATVPVTISIPTDAEAGGLYGSVLISTVSKAADSENSNSGSAIVSRIGTLMFVNIPGDVKVEGSLSAFQTTSERGWYNSGPIGFRILYENKGSVHVNPYGEIRIKNMFGEEVGSTEIEPWFAMPGSLRLREVVWDRPFLFGRYTAQAFINRGYQDIVDTATISFWVIPWKVVVVLVIVVFGLVFGVRFVFTRFEFRRKE